MNQRKVECLFINFETLNPMTKEDDSSCPPHFESRD